MLVRNKRWMQSAVVIMICLGMAGICLADFDDFISEKRLAQQIKFCGEDFNRCNSACAEGKDVNKCLEKCIKQFDKCHDAAPANAIDGKKLPPEAQKEYARIVKKQDTALNKCQNDYNAVMQKCTKKHGQAAGKEIIECIRKSGAQQKQDTCIEKAQQANSFRTKTMVALLKGKKP